MSTTIDKAVEYRKTAEMVKADIVCKHLRVHRNTLTKMIKEGMPYVIFGGRRRFSLIDVDTWLWNK